MRKIKARENLLYGRWCSMRQRCNNPNVAKYNRYGARGIEVCEEWEVFKNFEKWALNNGFKTELTLDRIDTNGNYEPNNCRWVDQKTQQNNRNNNRLANYKGKEYTFSELSEKTGLQIEIIAYRVSENIPIGAKKNFHHSSIVIDGETKNLRQWCIHFGTTYKTVYARVRRGWDPKEAILTPIREGNYK